MTATLDGGSLRVTASIDRSVPSGDYSGDIQVTGSDSRTYLLPFWVRVDR